MPNKSNITPETRFWAKVDKSGDCWLWTAGRMKDGYGGFNPSDPSRPRHMAAHRYSWELAHGPIPAGYFVCHRCDTPRCVNPDHLFLGTPADNHRDMVSKGRIARGDANGSRLRPERLHRGEQHMRAKFSETDIRRIRARHDAGEGSIRGMAREYAVTPRTIFLIVHRLGWQHVA